MASSVQVGHGKHAKPLYPLLIGIATALLAVAAGGVAFGFTLERLLGRL